MVCIRLVPYVTFDSHCFHFDVVERNLDQYIILKLGRYNTSRRLSSNRLSFKSKVVSRAHAEMYADEDGKIFIRDIGSSSGTFVNRVRIGVLPKQVCEGDVIQLGIDYQGGVEPMYRAVKLQLQIVHCDKENAGGSSNDNNNDIFRLAAFQRLMRQQSVSSDSSEDSADECCICLNAIAPSQALFSAPCSHVYHYRCIRPLLDQHFPSFSCPLCRTYSDLDASVEETTLKHQQQQHLDMQPARRSPSSSSTVTKRRYSTRSVSGSSSLLWKQMFSTTGSGLKNIIT